MTYDQSEFDVRCEWGLQGVRLLAPISDVVIIVDVLSFSTCVDIAWEWGIVTVRSPNYQLKGKLQAFAGHIPGDRWTHMLFPASDPERRCGLVHWERHMLVCNAVQHVRLQDNVPDFTSAAGRFSSIRFSRSLTGT